MSSNTNKNSKHFTIQTTTLLRQNKLQSTSGRPRKKYMQNYQNLSISTGKFVENIDKHKTKKLPNDCELINVASKNCTKASSRLLQKGNLMS